MRAAGTCCPHLIDPHVHAGHGTPERETFVHAGKAAFLAKKAEAEKSFVVDFGLWGGLVPATDKICRQRYHHG